MEIIKVYRESQPAVRLIGMKYTDADRDQYGSYASKWGEWFQHNLFAPLEKLALDTPDGGAYLGCMRCNSEFEYWIGVFCPEGTVVPEGYEFADIEPGDIGCCWIYGKENTGELYGDIPHNACMKELEERGWKLSEHPWFFERYQCPRFTTADEKDNVILDYCVYLAKEE